MKKSLSQHLLSLFAVTLLCAWCSAAIAQEDEKQTQKKQECKEEKAKKADKKKDVRFDVSPAAGTVNFDTMKIGSTYKTETFTIYNKGEDEIKFRVTGLNNPFQLLTRDNYVVEAGKSVKIRIRFNPKKAGTYRKSLHLRGDIVYDCTLSGKALPKK